MPQHRAGRLKQVNKKHKVPGGTKPSAEHAVAGRVARKTAKQVTAHTLGYLLIPTSIIPLIYE